jgi:hypothetical protein
MTKRVLGTLLLLTVVAVPLHADFHAIAKAIDSERGVKRLWIPFLGLARVAVRIAAPEGIHDFQLVTFTGTESVDPRRLGAIIRAQAGPGFTPLVQTWSKRSNDWSFIYARPSKSGNRLELMVLARDNENAVLVRVDVDANKIARELRSRPREVSHVARR